jgi:O-antigen/teichoic acid export membrane protein
MTSRQNSFSLTEKGRGSLPGDPIWEKPPKRRQAAMVHLIGGYFNIGLTILQGFLLVPLYLHYLGPRLYGLWLASGGVLAWLAVLDMGLGSLMIQRTSRSYGQKDAGEVGLYFFNGLLLQCGFMALLVGGAALLASWLPVWFKATAAEAPPLQWCFLLAAVSVAMSILNNGAASLSQSLQRPLFMIIATAACTLVGLLATILFLWIGLGLWAIPGGLLTRNVPLLTGNLLYSLWLVNRAGGRLRYDKAIMADMLKLSPALFTSKFGSGLVGQIEPVLIASMIRPELAAAFAITKRAGDVIKLLLDRVAGAVFPGFSHLYARGEKDKAADVAGQVMTLVFSAGLVCLGAYIAGNASFVRLWVGDAHFVGQGVTILIAVSIFMIITNNLLSYLLGATGDISRPALLIFAEAVLRVVLMLLLLPSLGLVGLPVAMIISTSLFSLVFYFRFVSRLPFSFSQFTKPLKSLGLILVIGGSAVAFQHLVICKQWWQLIGGLFGFLILSGAYLLLLYYQLFSSMTSLLKRGGS